MKSNSDRRWLLVVYRPTTLFSLRITNSTSSGGKTLVVPTPYAIKLAMLDAAFRIGYEDLARDIFDSIASVDIRIQPPEHLTVNHTFIKVKRQPKNPTPELPFIPSISFRDFCFYRGDMTLALDSTKMNEDEIEKIVKVLAHINYFGKRGSFFQFIKTDQVTKLPPHFTVQMGNLEQEGGQLYDIVQLLDDIGETRKKDDLFEAVNSYSAKPITLGKQRVLAPTVIPYRLQRTTNRYDYYVRK